MLVLCACIAAKSGESCTTDGGIGDHTLDCKLHGTGGLRLEKDLSLGGLEMSDITGVTVVDLLLHLVAGENSLVTVDNDNMIATINMRCEGGLVLAAKKGSSLSSYSAEGLACCVKNIPLAVNLTCLGHKCRH